MIRFSIDYFEKKAFFKQLDYSNKVILNAIADPLFIYDKKENKYIPHACSSHKVKGKTHIIILKENLYFYDGSKVTAQDYIDEINDNKDLINLNISSIKAKENKIIINLKNKDKCLIKKLSVYLAAPHKNKTSGRYYINKTYSNRIELIPNKYYRIRANEKLEFIKLETLKENIEYFSKKKIDITNNTLIKINNKNKKVEKSGIIYSLEISSKYSKSTREKIVKSINKNNIVLSLGSSYFIKNNFFFKEETKYKYRKKKNQERQKLKLSYNKFYPNKEIAELIKKELEKNNFKVELVENSYEDFKVLSTFDLRLTLNYFEYIDDFYFYNSKYFKYIMKKNILYSVISSKCSMKRYLNKMFRKKYIKEPLISFYSDYKITRKTEDFSYLECNYSKIKS